MTSDHKIKEAFARVKTDMDMLRMHVNDLKKTNTLTDDVKKQIDRIRRLNVEQFTQDMQNEFKSINSLIKEFNIRFKKNSEDMIEISKKLDKFNNEVRDLKSKIVSAQNKAANSSLDVNLINERIPQLQELLNEKISLEVASIKLETRNEIIYLAEEVERLKSELAFMRGEKVGGKTTKKEVVKASKAKTTVSKTKQTKAKKPSKIKKAGKWLFEDEKEDLASVKAETLK